MKKMVPLAALLLLACAQLSSQAYIYEHCDYKGQSRYLTVGNYATYARFGLADQSISGLEVSPGYVVQLFKEPYFGGASYTISQNTRCLPSGWNDKVRSLKVLQAAVGQPEPLPDGNTSGDAVAMYSSCNYGGNVVRFKEGNFRDLKTALGRRPLASMQIPQGMIVELYSGTNFMGNMVGRFYADQKCINQFAVNNAQSARISAYTPGGGGSGGSGGNSSENVVRVFERCNYGGRSVTFKEGSFANFPVTLSNRPASAIQIPAGMVVELYSGPNFTGSMVGRFTTNQACLQNTDRYARSARMYYSGWGGGGGGVMPEMGAAASIYSSCNYGGIRRMLDEGNYPNLSYEQIRNVASIKLSPGYAMVLYAAPNYGGAQSGVIDADNACLGSYWQRTAKSARVYKTDESSGWQGGGGSSATGIRIFSDCNYRGASQELAPGRYNMNGQVNFTPAAFQVPPGFEVVLYNNPMLTGAQTIIRENMACLGEYWRNNTRVIVVKGSGSAIKPLSANN